MAAAMEVAMIGVMTAEVGTTGVTIETGATGKLTARVSSCTLSSLYQELQA